MLVEHCLKKKTEKKGVWTLRGVSARRLEEKTLYRYTKKQQKRINSRCPKKRTIAGVTAVEYYD